MDRFWINLKNLLVEHEKCVDCKINYGYSVKELNKGSSYLPHYVVSNYINNLILEYNLNNKILKNIFYKIINECINYINYDQIDFQMLEDQFREKNINIYIIAKKFTRTNNIYYCKLNNINKEFEANFVITKYHDYYLKELEKFGCSEENNYDNLKKCGILLMNDSYNLSSTFY